MSEFLYEVGDTFEGGPAEISRWITEITSAGADFDLTKEGVLTIIAVKEKKNKSEAKAPVAHVETESYSNIAEEAVATIKMETVEAVEEAEGTAEVTEAVGHGIDSAVEVVEDVVEQVAANLAADVAAEEAKPAPAKRGRKPKTTAPETTEE